MVISDADLFYVRGNLRLGAAAMHQGTRMWAAIAGDVPRWLEGVLETSSNQLFNQYINNRN